MLSQLLGLAEPNRSLIEITELLDVPIEWQNDVLLKFFGELPTPSCLTD